MLSIRLKEITLSNFKSFKEQTVTLADFNVIVGRNASGKTNFIEFLKFVKKILLDEHRPFMPFIEWWSLRNISWNGNEELPIGATFKFKIDKLDVEYELLFGRMGGRSRILSERLDVKKIVLLERDEQTLRIKHYKEFISKNAKRMRKALSKFNAGIKTIAGKEAKRVTMKRLAYQEVGLPRDFRNLLVQLSGNISFGVSHESIDSMIIIPDIKNRETYGLIVTPRRKKGRGAPFFVHIMSRLENAIRNIIILRHPNMKEVKTPSIPKGEEILLEDGSNLHNVLYNWFVEKAKLPDRIETAISKIFPDTQIAFKLSHEGKVYLQITEKGLQLAPPCISDGFYKILAILAALELKPSLLAIDEIENSLFAEALEYLIDELKNAGTTVIVTTHSPLIVDMVDLQDLLIAERTIEGTTLTRIKNVEKLKQKLAELKITQSESWLGGALSQ